MVTLTLIQGVVNTFVILLSSRVVGHVVESRGVPERARLRPGLLHRHDRRAGGALDPRVR